MEISDLERLAALVQNSGLGELTIKQGDSCVTLKQSAKQANVYEFETQDQDERQDEYVDSSYTDSEATLEDIDEKVTAPLVGIFTNVKPMIASGAKVKLGQTVCYIEAMNIQSDVKCHVSGIVTDVFIEAGHPVEYGQPLFAIRPDASTS